MRRILVLLPVLLALQVGVSPALAWTWPVNGPVLQHFSFGGDPYAGGQHRGIDVGGQAGASVVAPAGGTVSFAGTVPDAGRTVTIQTGDGFSVTLVHLGTLSVGRGETVAEGAPVGTIGPSGTPELGEPYVHLGIRVANEAEGYLDPLSFLPPRAGAAASASEAPEQGPASEERPAEPVNVGESDPVADAQSTPAGAESPEGETATPAPQSTAEAGPPAIEADQDAPSAGPTEAPAPVTAVVAAATEKEKVDAPVVRPAHAARPAPAPATAGVLAAATGASAGLKFADPTHVTGVGQAVPVVIRAATSEAAPAISRSVPVAATMPRPLLPSGIVSVPGVEKLRGARLPPSGRPVEAQLHMRPRPARVGPETLPELDRPSPRPVVLVTAAAGRESPDAPRPPVGVPARPSRSDGAWTSGAVTLAVGVGALGALGLALLGWWGWGRAERALAPTPVPGGAGGTLESVHRVESELERALERILEEEAERRATVRPGEVPSSS